MCAGVIRILCQNYKKLTFSVLCKMLIEKMFVFERLLPFANAIGPVIESGRLYCDLSDFDDLNEGETLIFK